jgi:D-alanine-D-alanine ligase
MTPASLKVAVLMGGPSAEHEISLKSGQGVVAALSRRHWVVEPVVIAREMSVDEAREWTGQALERIGADVAFIALHGAFGEDGTIQDLCEGLHVTYTGSDAASSRLGMDKVASRRKFEAVGLSVPPWQVIDHPAECPQPGRFSYPVVVKPTSQGSSLGVSIVRQPQDLAAAVNEAARYGSRVLIETFVPGREVTVGVFGEVPLPIVEIRPHHPFFDYTAKYTAGATEYVVPALIDPSVARVVQEAGLAAHHALGCRHLSRADFILRDDDVPVLLEVNTIPGFTPTSLLPKAAACIGLSYEELCEHLVIMAAQSASVRPVAHAVTLPECI